MSSIIDYLGCTADWRFALDDVRDEAGTPLDLTSGYEVSAAFRSDANPGTPIATCSMGNGIEIAAGAPKGLDLAKRDVLGNDG